MIRHSQARHHYGADCTLGGKHGRNLREEETPVREFTHGMWRQRMACQVMPMEVGYRGFVGRTTTSYLSRLALTNRARRRATHQRQTAAERASNWIWSKVRKSTTAWRNRPPSSLLPYPHPTPPNPTLPTDPLTPSQPPPSLSPLMHTEHRAAFTPHSDITQWLNLLAAPEYGVPPVANKSGVYFDDYGKKLTVQCGTTSCCSKGTDRDTVVNGDANHTS